MNRLLKNTLTIIVIHFLSFSYGFPIAETTIEIKGKSCKYNIIVPYGWDTIPVDTLQKKFGKYVYDAGLYFSANNQKYFDGEYIQYSFLATNISLSQFSFAQIVSEFRGGVSSKDKLLGTDKTTELSIDNFIEDIDNKVFYISGKIYSSISEREYNQMLIPTKFGILKVIHYKAKNGTIKSVTDSDLFATVIINPDFKYIEPSPKSNLNIWHIAVAFAIGLVVYFIIQYYPKIRQSSSKRSKSNSIGL
jgi:hypothetical protein